MSALGNRLFQFGISHKTAPLDLRERLALDPARQESLHRSLSKASFLREYALLNTCNRCEIYGVGEADQLLERVRTLFAEVVQCEPSTLEPVSTLRQGVDAVQHLMAVSSGLDSQMIGETEVAGQVKQAYRDASESETLGPVLNRLFQKSFQAAKWIRTHTTIQQGQVSLGNVAVDLANRIVGDLSKSRILLIGSGQVGADTAKALKSRGAHDVAVTSRTDSRAHELATEIGAAPILFGEWPARLREFDIVVCSTSAPGSILFAETVEKALHERPGLPLFLIDLAVPRDIETSAGELANVFLYNLEDLAAIANENRKERLREAEQAHGILNERATRLWLQLEPVVMGGPPSQASSPKASHRPIPKFDFADEHRRS